MGYAAIVLDVVVATRPSISERAVHFDVEFDQTDGSSARIRVVATSWNEGLKGITRCSRVLIGGQLRCRGRPTVIAGRSTILWLAPEDEDDNPTPRRLHEVEAHWRLLATGKRIRVRAHVRGRVGIARNVRSLVHGMPAGRDNIE